MMSSRGVDVGQVGVLGDVGQQFDQAAVAVGEHRGRSRQFAQPQRRDGGPERAGQLLDGGGDAGAARRGGHGRRS
jgi:hypothetical protein